MISRCPSCAAQVSDDATRCPSCHWDFNQLKRIPPAGEAVNPTVAPKNAAPPPPAKPKLPPARSIPPPPTVDPSILPKARPRADLPDGAAPPPKPQIIKKTEPAPSTNFSIPTFKSDAPPPAEAKPPKAEPPKFTHFSEEVDVPPAKPREKERENFADRATPRARPVERPAEKPADLPSERPAEKRPQPAPRPDPATPISPVSPPPPPDAMVPETVIQRLPSKAETFRARKPGGPDAPPPAEEDVPDRLKRRSPTDGQPSKEIKRQLSNTAPMVLLGVAAVVVAVGAVAAVKFLTRSDVVVGTRGNSASVFKQPAEEPAERTASGSSPSRPPSESPSSAVDDSRSIQRLRTSAMAIDPLHPELGVMPIEQVHAAAAAAVQAATAKAVAVDPLHPEHGLLAVPAPKPAPVPVPAPPAAKPVPKAAPPVAKEEYWVFEGEVYDILSLRAVYMAQLEFRNPSGLIVADAVTRENGRYRVQLPPVDPPGYSIIVKHPDYRARHIDDLEPPLKVMSDQERRTVMNAQAMPRPWLGSVKAVSKRSIVLVPTIDPEAP